MNLLWKTMKSTVVRLLCVLLFGFLISVTSVERALASSINSVNSVQQETKRKIEGVVKDQSGETLIGVSVVVEGTTVGTITDLDGHYNIEVTGEKRTLVFSYVGYTTQRVAADKNLINIVMSEDNITMKEVVVVGYGAQRKENLTGAVASINVEKTLGSRPIADVGRGLQGTVAGLTVTLPSSEVGSDPSIKIRGAIGSIEGDTKPLILLDNVEIPSIQMVNPDDIESISVLKDASSTSIYGSKGAYGVVLITSKKGSRIESVSVTYSNNFSWQTSAKELEMAGVEGLRYSLDAQRNRKTPAAAGTFWRVDEESFPKILEWQEKYAGKVGKNDPVLYGRDWYMGSDGLMRGLRIYNPMDMMIEEWTPTQTHNLSIGGRSNKTTYNIGLGYMDQSGMLKPAKHDDYKRYNASFNIASELNKYLTVRAGAIYSDRNKRYAAIAAPETSDPWLSIYRFSMLYPMGVEENGMPVRSSYYEAAEANTANIQNTYTSINLGATVNFTQDWDLVFDYTHSNTQLQQNDPIRMYTAKNVWQAAVPWLDENGNRVFVDENGMVTTEGGMEAYTFNPVDYIVYGVNNSSLKRKTRITKGDVFNVYSTYNLKLGANAEHVFKFMAGMNRVTMKWTQHISKQNDLLDYDNPQFEFATGEEFAYGTDATGAGQYWEGQLGFFGRINYVYDSKYLLEANLRYDGSSKFPKRLWWRAFPSFSAGWVVSNEKFMEPVSPVLSFAKLRGSWGSIGDQAVPNSLYVPSINPVSGSSGAATWIGVDGRPWSPYSTPKAVQADVTWQTVEHLNLGADLRFYHDKFGVTVDWYQRDTKNMLMSGAALPYSFGTTEPKGNFGNLRTRGWEISVDFNHRFRNGLGISVTGMFHDGSTFITKGPDHNIPWENRNIGDSYYTGRRYGDIWGYVTDRLYQKDDFVYNDDGSIKQVTIIMDGVSKQSNMLVGDNPVYQTDLESGEVAIFHPGDVKFVDINGDGYITPGKSTLGDPGDRKVIGNTTPRYEYGFRLGLDYKGFDASIFIQGVGKREMWGSGQLAIAGYNAKDGAMPLEFATNYWTEDRTDAFYPRAWDLLGENTGYSMRVQTRYLLDMSYTKIKNITFGYSLPANLLKRVYLSKARIYVSLENFFTFDNLRGLPIDPEVVSGQSMFTTGNNYNQGRTGVGTPAFKSASVGVQLSF